MVTYRLIKGEPLTHAEFDANMAAIEDARTLLLTSEETLELLQAMTNFQGLWSDLSGALDKPATVYHTGRFWVLLNNLTDVTLSEPALGNTDWGTVVTLPEQTGNADKFLSTDGTVSSWVDLVNVLISAATISASTLSGSEVNTSVMTESQYNQIADASLGTGTHTFDYSLGDMQQLTATGNISIAFSNFPTGKVASFIIDAVNWGAYEIAYPVGTQFSDKTEPAYTISGTDRLQVVKDKDDVYTLSVSNWDIGVPV